MYRPLCSTCTYSEQVNKLIIVLFCNSHSHDCCFFPTSFYLVCGVCLPDSLNHPSIPPYFSTPSLYFDLFFDLSSSPYSISNVRARWVWLFVTVATHISQWTRAMTKPVILRLTPPSSKLLTMLLLLTEVTPQVLEYITAKACLSLNELQHSVFHPWI